MRFFFAHAAHQYEYQRDNTLSGGGGPDVLARLGAVDKLKKLGADAYAEEHPGAHTWDYWDAHIESALGWMPLKRRLIRE